MKSAIELAMEKDDGAVDGDDYVKLTPEQVQAIDQVTKEYEAKWAEQEIMIKGKLEKMQQEVDPQTMAEHQRQFQTEINQLREQIFAERDSKLEKIRQQAP